MSHQGHETAASAEIRPTSRQDARDIASRFLVSSDRQASCIWALIAEPGANLLDVGMGRYERENTAFSYRNTPALDLYASPGFREIDRRAVVPHPSLHYTDGGARLPVRDLERKEQDR